MSDKFPRWLGHYEHNLIKNAAEIVDLDFVKKYEEVPKGSFLFNDNTIQNWTIDQLYGWFAGKAYDAIDNPEDLVRKPLVSGQFSPSIGFILKNHQNRALAASAGKVFQTFDPNLIKVSFYLESPDLTSNNFWQNAKGYTFDVQRMFCSSLSWVKAKAYDNPNHPEWSILLYSVQRQMRIIKIDKLTNKKSYHIYAQTDTHGNFTDNKIEYNQNYRWAFTPEILSNPPAGFETKLHKIRIRCLMPANGLLTIIGGWGNPGGGHWLIGNVYPTS